MCTGREFQVNGAETKTCEEKLPVIQDGLGRRFVMEERRDLNGRLGN